MLDVVRLEVPILALVEMDQDRHEFALAQFTCSFSMDTSIMETLTCPFWRALLAEIIDMAVQFQ
jgi:hypothetical protein